MNNTTDYNATTTTAPFVYDYSFGDEFLLQAFTFETPVYLYVWEILVVISIAIAVVFMVVLLQKKLRSVTSYIICAIAISDALTGIVTLPVYLIVYGQLGSGSDEDYSYEYDDDWSDYAYAYSNYTIDGGEADSFDSFLLTKVQCDSYMISRYLLSRMFHTISIWLTVFLGTQRCLSVLSPFNAPAWFTKTKTAIICVSIGVLALLLHGFHVFHSKTVDGNCIWYVSCGSGEGGCIQLWLELSIRHFVPCIILTITTVLMVRSLLKSSFQKTRLESMKKFKRGGEAEDENRLVSKIVTAIVIVFLLTEVPYGLFLLYITTRTNPAENSLRTNRIVATTYELTMVVSFNANFAIFIAFNRRFMSEFKRIFCCCCRNPAPAKEQQKLQNVSVSKSSEQNPPETELSTLT